LLFSEGVSKSSELVSDQKNRCPKRLHRPNTKSFRRDYKDVWRAVDEAVSRWESRYRCKGRCAATHVNILKG
jgi:hypothetical protein